MSDQINRRNFIKGGAAMFTLAALNSGLPTGPALAATDQPYAAMMSRFSMLANSEASRVVSVREYLLAQKESASANATVTPAAVIPPIPPWLIELAKQLVIGVVGGTVADWFTDLRRSDRMLVKNTNNKMARADYKDRSQDTVYGNRHLSMYCVSHWDKLNACVPVFAGCADTGLGKPVIIEGPLVVGLTLAAQDWRARWVSKADGLIPLQIIDGKSTKFQRSMEEPFIAETAKGLVGMLYEKHRGQKSGKMTVISVDKRERRLFEESYDLTDWM